MTIFWWIVAYICFGILYSWMMFAITPEEFTKIKLAEYRRKGMPEEYLQFVVPLARVFVALAWPILLPLFGFKLLCAIMRIALKQEK